MESTKLKDGGPAFAEVVPVELENEPGRNQRRVGGMTMRQYFAASAPEAPDWYTGQPLPLPVLNPSWQFCEGCKGESDCQHTADCEKIFAYRSERDQMQNANKALRLFQWRWYYADGMIAAMESASPKTPTLLGLSDAIKIAKGCFDYSGGHSNEADREVFHHGIQTVVNALEAAARNGLSDTQVNVLHKIGSK